MLPLVPVSADDSDEDDEDFIESSLGSAVLQDGQANGLLLKRQSRSKKLGDIFEVLSVVGAGSFGIVVACRELTTLRRKVALKIAPLNRQCPT